jgi:hypothetical protein
VLVGIAVFVGVAVNVAALVGVTAGVGVQSLGLFDVAVGTTVGRLTHGGVPAALTFI